MDVVPENAYNLIIKIASTFPLKYVKPNRKLNNIVWYNMYIEKIGKTPIDGILKKSSSQGLFVDYGFVAPDEAEKVRIEFGVDWPDFSTISSLELYGVSFTDYDNDPLNFEDLGDLGWQVKQNYGNHFSLSISSPGGKGSEKCYRVQRKTRGMADTSFRLLSSFIPVSHDRYLILSFKERHNYNFTRVSKGYCRILWFDIFRNPVGESVMGSLLEPHSVWFLWIKPFFRAPKAARMARIEFGNDWPDFRHGDFWEVDNIWLRKQ